MEFSSYHGLMVSEFPVCSVQELNVSSYLSFVTVVFFLFGSFSWECDRAEAFDFRALCSGTFLAAPTNGAQHSS